MTSSTLGRTARRTAITFIVGFLASIALLGGAGPASAADAPAWSLRPFVDCVWKNADGTFTVSLGYESSNAGTVNVAVGANNLISPGAQNQGQPTSFLPGSHSNVWALTLTSANYQSGTWSLASASMNMTMNGTACSSKPVPLTAGSGIVFLATTALVAVGGAAALVRRRRRTW